MSLYQRLRGHAEFQPEKTAIESEAGKQTYRQLKAVSYTHLTLPTICSV